MTNEFSECVPTIKHIHGPRDPGARGCSRASGAGVGKVRRRHGNIFVLVMTIGMSPSHKDILFMGYALGPGAGGGDAMTS
jgi:hypothetical protein